MSKETSLSCLTSAALALPALAQAAPDMLEDAQVEYQFSYYDEADERMQARTHQVRASLQPSDKLNLNLDLTRDTLSGASPMFNMPVEGQTQQILSGASIHEKRDVVSFGASYKMAKNLLKVGLGRSVENDYKSNFYSLGLSRYLNQKNTQVDVGVGLSLDKHGIADQPLTDKKRSLSYHLGVTQLLSPQSFIQANLGYGQHRGVLSDPYKKVYIEGKGLDVDLRPESRYQSTLSLLYARQFKSNDSALHLGYRYYQDNWDIKAHTLSAKYHYPLAKGWMLIPEFRYYKQNSADFYQVYFNQDSIGSYHSSDYRLADFSAQTWGLSVNKRLSDKAKIELGWQSYRSRRDTPNPLAFDLLRLAIKLQF